MFVIVKQYEIREYQSLQKTYQKMLFLSKLGVALDFHIASYLVKNARKRPDD